MVEGCDVCSVRLVGLLCPSWEGDEQAGQAVSCYFLGDWHVSVFESGLKP